MKDCRYSDLFRSTMSSLDPPVYQICNATTRLYTEEGGGVRLNALVFMYVFSVDKCG